MLCSSAGMHAEVERRDQPFADRQEAGRVLAGRLQKYSRRTDVIVLALPRGGVPVAAIVAATINAPLDVLNVRKIGAPQHPELAIGAIASGGARVFNHELIASLGLTQLQIDRVIAAEERELARREAKYRNGRPDPDIAGRLVIIVDDGLATGATMKAAVMALRELGPSRIVVAVPVGSVEACESLATVADEVICARIPQRFVAVGRWYRDFSETTDDEVRQWLATTSPSAARSPS